MRTRFGILAAFTVLVACVTAHADQPATGFLFKSIHSGDRDYKYTIFVPREYSTSTKWPAIVFLHGAGECGTDGVKQVAQGIGSAILWHVDKWPFIVLFPQKPVMQEQWEAYDATVMAMLAEAEKDYSVDRSRIYLTGLSQGGHGTWTLGANHPDVWAALAPICGYGDAEAIAPKVKSLPVWCFHGEADGTVPVKQSRDIVAALKAAGCDAKLTTYPGVDHNSWDKAYRDETLYDWFLAHKRG